MASKATQYSYISGDIIRNLVKNIDCQDCITSMVQSAASTNHQYSATAYTSHLNCKNMGGFTQASYGSYKDVAAVEKVFKLKWINIDKKCTYFRYVIPRRFK